MKKIVFWVVLFVIFSSALVFLYIWENLALIVEQAAVTTSKPTKHRLPSEAIHRSITYDSDKNLKLDIYTVEETLNEKGNEKKNEEKSLPSLYPVLVFVPGGLWQGNNKKNYSHIAFLGKKKKMVTVVLSLPFYAGLISRKFLSRKQLKAGGFFTQLEALGSAMIWIKKHIKKYKGDPSQINMIAFGSGAHIAALTLISKDDVAQNSLCSQIHCLKNIQKLILISPILDLLDVSAEFHQNHIVPVFQSAFDEHSRHNKNVKKNQNAGDNSTHHRMSLTDFLRKVSPLHTGLQHKISTLILSPEQNHPFLLRQAERFAQKYSFIRHTLVKDTTKRSILFRLGRKEMATKAIYEFLGQPKL